MKRCLIEIILLFALSPFALVSGKDYLSIQNMFDSIKECRIDSLKLEIHQRINEKVSELLEDPSSFDEPFDQLVNLGKIYSDDHMVRVYTWSFPLEDKTFQYGGYVQYKNKNKVTTTPLLIQGDPVLPAEEKKLDNNHWYGALYYRLFKVKKKKETYYIALGWSGLNAATDFKVIEPMQFSSNGKLQSLGKMVFKETGRKAPYRIILEYNSEGKVTLDYTNQENRIIFDHLMPIEPIYTGIKSYYGPDFTYDAFLLKKGDWHFEENIDARNR